MADFYKQITGDQGSVEDLIRKIPGFKGYFEKEDRRNADELLRQHLVREFEEVHSEFSRLQEELVDSGGIMHMERVQGIDTKLRTFIDRIESAAEGYAGLFDATKVKEDDLARVYAFDNALLEYKTQLNQGLEALSDAIRSEELDIKNVLRQLDNVVSEANNTFKRRKEAMQGMYSDE